MCYSSFRSLFLAKTTTNFPRLSESVLVRKCFCHLLFRLLNLGFDEYCGEWMAEMFEKNDFTTINRILDFFEKHKICQIYGEENLTFKETTNEVYRISDIISRIYFVIFVSKHNKLFNHLKNIIIQNLCELSSLDKIIQCFLECSFFNLSC